MKLYIDTNTYASYVSLTSDIKSLEKLKVLIEKKKVELVLPSQTKDEFDRHYKERVEKAKQKLKVPATQLDIPNELKGKKKDEYTKDEKNILEKITLINSEIKTLIQKRGVELKKHLESVEKLLSQIFKLATPLEDNEEIIVKAVVRHVKGLPPKKEKENFKFGDAIIWETLKSYIKTEDLIIVSSDPDFSDSSKKGKPAKINKFLKKEWKKHTKKELLLYPLLGHFVNSVEKEDPVSPETIKKEAVQATVSTRIHQDFHFNNTQEPFLYTNQLATNQNPYINAINITTPLSTGATIPIAGTNWYNSSSININEGSLSDIIRNSDEGTKMFSIRPNNAFICARCGKTFDNNSLPNTGLFSNLCNDCSKYFTI